MSSKENAAATATAAPTVNPVPPVPEPWKPGDKPVAYVHPFYWGVMTPDQQKTMQTTFAIILTEEVPGPAPDPEPVPPKP